MAIDVSVMRAPLATGRMGGDTLSWDAFGNLFTDYGQTGGLRVSRRGNGYTVEIPTPGFKPDEIGVTLDDGVLTVTARNDKRQFTRLLLLPEEIDSANIQANVEHGLLTLTLDGHPKAQPKKIEVTHD
jgi:HSP20 family molecular chaperone IbpA